MSTHRFHHESHGNHPMSYIGFVLALGGFAMAALWLVNMAAGNVGAAIVCGLLTVAAFAIAVSIFFSLSHRYHHSPVLPDNTPDETERYVRKYRG
ncbi:hypothetical protein IA539_06030 [Gordonia sp. zg691]|uniref:Amino acid transporter n=1 Tax=Gordonia jinghuaiqii TaxID=2758710 RepID=A0A7D7QGM4_9ACTN|nr:hypothetical protein [Gordonia jinghuaiqii]MBD0860765.1 hypothetical protein [Gordonia jinghuaiqii]MCR5979674.1 hypothetical protein [Gordonia jinghuaiqii]QMT00544.1 hypothetical protein H1R19_16800 [Gordonia jinghuaiqii]